MLWLALHLPQLALEAFCATRVAQTPPQPVALLQGAVLVAVDAVAAQRGLRPGLQRATAQALAADLLLAEREPARDAAALRAVAHAALAFTPCVTEHDADTVLLEVHASLRLFGGLAALTQALQQALAPLGHRLQCAAAPTAAGAALLAQWWPPDLAEPVLGAHATQRAALQTLLRRAPLPQLAAARAHAPALLDMGLRTLADLQPLPRAGLTRRFGPALLDELDRVLGRKPDPRSWLQPPPQFEARLELLTQAEHTAQILPAAAVLLARLVAWAQSHRARLAGFSLRLLHERRRDLAPPDTVLRLALAEPAADAQHLQTLLRERLARLVLPAPTLELQLQCRELVALPAPNGELFPTPASRTEGLTRLLERLCARLGDDRVQRLQAVSDHRPECATVAVPALLPLHARPAGRRETEAGAAALPLHRPVWLLPQPQGLSGPDDRPWLRGRPLHLLSGPERLETGWWDEQPVLRDYFIAAADDGALVWIYRNRLPAAVTQTPPAPGASDAGWMLHGWFG